jgi:hypothetical protein
MELIRDFGNVNNKFTQKIKITKYTEGENLVLEKTGVEDICEIIISQNIQEYDTIQKNHIENFVTNKKLEIADDVKKNEKYNRSFTPRIIQTGLQNKNYLSSILYMNEIYKINTVIYNSTTLKYYPTSLMDYPKLFCEYKGNTWFEKEENIEGKLPFNPISELSEILTIDTDIMIFKSKLESLSKYKIKDLEKMCCENSILTIKKDGKKKLKKELYDELSMVFF